MDIALASLSRLIALKPKALFYSHFGRASDATEKLNAYAQQLELWAGIARKGIRDGEDLKTIGRKIVEGDKAISKALEHISVHPILGETVLSESVLGVVDFVRKSVAE